MEHNGVGSDLYVRRHAPTETLECPTCRRHVAIVFDGRTNIHSLSGHGVCAGSALPVAFLPERYAVVSLVFNREGKILAVSRKGNPKDVGLPGGKAELGEDPFDAVVRETQEETSIVIHKARYVYWRRDYSMPGDPRPTIPALCFIVDAYEGVPIQAEAGWVGWVTPSAVAAKDCSFHAYNRDLFDAIMVPYDDR